MVPSSLQVVENSISVVQICPNPVHLLYAYGLAVSGKIGTVHIEQVDDNIVRRITMGFSRRCILMVSTLCNSSGV